ncbi:MAG: sulfatase modifying factor 1 [Candidatus Promineifilaceae bacterium]|jgi:sulfatase modifying factor 1
MLKPLKVAVLSSAPRCICVVFLLASALCAAGAEHNNRMLHIPAGAFMMGDGHDVGGRDERPAHRVSLSAFWMDRLEVSNADMRDVMQWAFDNGHVRVETNGVFNVHGASRELLDGDDWNAEIHFKDDRFTVLQGRDTFPCIEVTWFGALAYANFRSLREGLAPCIDLVDWHCTFRADGYRLPSEAEWERAARGGLEGHHYPWASPGEKYWEPVRGRHANFWGSDDAYENEAGYNLSTPVGYYNGEQRPAGVVMTNGYGLMDMTGNVEEWCWDVYNDDEYRKERALQKDPVGPAGGSYRVVRGGSWITGQKEAWAEKSIKSQRYHLRIADRTRRDPRRGQHFRGFRCVRR